MDAISSTIDEFIVRGLLLLSALLIGLAWLAQYQAVSEAYKKKGYDESMGCLSMLFMGWPEAVWHASLLPNQRKRRESTTRAEDQTQEFDKHEAELEAKAEELAARERELERRERELEERERGHES